MAHTVFRSDNCSYTHDGAKIRTVVLNKDIDNGCPVTMGALATSGTYAGEREVFTVTDATAVKEVWVVCTPEVDYEENPITEFYNKAGKIGRAVLMEKADIFSVSAEALSAVPTAGQGIVAKAGGWTVGTVGSTSFAKCIGSDVQDGVTMYRFEVL